MPQEVAFGLFDFNDRIVTTWPDTIYAIYPSHDVEHLISIVGSTTYLFVNGLSTIMQAEVIFKAEEGVSG